MNRDNAMFRPREMTMSDRASTDARAAFIAKTYQHLLGAVLAFIALEAALLNSPIAEAMVNFAFSTQYTWLMLLGGFVFVSWIANSWAHSDTSLGMQYGGLALYVVAEAFIFLPLMYFATTFDRVHGANLIPMAGVVTGVTFLGLTAIVFMTRKNFSFLGPILGVAGIAAFAGIGCSILFGFSLGILFMVAMIVLASGSILYSTSNVLHEYRTDQYVAASLTLFAGVALLFYYVVMLLMSLSRD